MLCDFMRVACVSLPVNNLFSDVRPHLRVHSSSRVSLRASWTSLAWPPDGLKELHHAGIVSCSAVCSTTQPVIVGAFQSPAHRRSGLHSRRALALLMACLVGARVLLHVLCHALGRVRSEAAWEAQLRVYRHARYYWYYGEVVAHIQLLGSHEVEVDAFGGVWVSWCPGSVIQCVTLECQMSASMWAACR